MVGWASCRLPAALVPFAPLGERACCSHLAFAAGLCGLAGGFSPVGFGSSPRRSVLATFSQLEFGPARVAPPFVVSGVAGVEAIGRL